MDIIIILSSWSSGSTAVAGYLDRLGAFSCPPHVLTNDPRTPDCYEPKILKDGLTACMDETTLRLRQDPENFSRFLDVWLKEETEKARADGRSHLVLKHPLLAFFLPQILSVCHPRILVVTRPFADIEATRIRRNWPAVYGKAGAQACYRFIVSNLIEQKASSLTVAYDDFLADAALRRDMEAFCHLVPSPEQRAAAEAWLGKKGQDSKDAHPCMTDTLS